MFFMCLVSVPEPIHLPETFKKKDVIEILSHKKAHNACKQHALTKAPPIVHSDVHEDNVVLVHDL